MITQTRPDPLSIRGVIEIILEPGQTSPFAGLGEVFAIVGKGAYPNHVGKLVLYAIPLDKSVADAACWVALGSHRAVRIKPAKE